MDQITTWMLFYSLSFLLSYMLRAQLYKDELTSKQLRGLSAKSEALLYRKIEWCALRRSILGPVSLFHALFVIFGWTKERPLF